MNERQINHIIGTFQDHLLEIQRQNIFNLSLMYLGFSVLAELSFIKIIFLVFGSYLMYKNCEMDKIINQLKEEK